MPIPFRKMNGLGNDFAIVDARARPFAPSAGAIRRLADRQTGIGFDQLITIAPAANGADASMLIHNADGGEVQSCGNATRCVADILFGESGAESVRIATRGGLLTASRGEDGLIVVDMGRPRFDWASIPLACPVPDPLAIADLSPRGLASVANVGNPHLVIWVDDARAVDLAAEGAPLERNPLFPERVNVSFAEVAAPDTLTLRVWERGAGATRACGTAACAAAVLSATTGRTGRSVAVDLPGGRLTIDYTADGRILMAGPVAYEYEGELTAD